MTIIIVAESMRTGDAVGNTVMQEYFALKKYGHEILLYSGNADNDFTAYLIDRTRLLKEIKKQDAVLLYHHSIYWEDGGYILREAQARVVLRYHNVTPEHFFARYSPLFQNLAKQGRQQTKEFIDSGRIAHYVADSAYNASELVECHAPPERISIVAPFHKVGDFERTHLNLDLLESLLDGRINVLSVGRIVPNKGLHHAMKVIDRYLDYYGNNIRFNIVGGSDPHFQRYQEELEELVSRYGMGGHVAFHGKVSFPDLHTYYAASHVLLLLSEHEGFCLPILEAQYHKLPVIALDRGAVKDTLGVEQLSFQDIDADVFASAIHVVAQDNDTRNYLAEQGFRNHQRYHPDILARQLTGIMHAAR